MNFLGKVFKIKKKQKTYLQENKFKLCIVDEKAEYIHTILGVTDEKAKELVKIAVEAYNNNNDVINSMQQILDNCSHINEVVLALKAYEKITYTNQNSLQGLIGEILKKHGH